MPENPGGLRLAIAGGGTGGHVLPALACVEELCARGQIEDLLWIGSQEGHERGAADEAGIRFVAIPTGKFRRYFSVRNVTDAVRVPVGILAARNALRKFGPHVVLSTGGFVSVPGVIAARGIAPVLTHEQTAILGLATRINARFADVLALSHAQSAPEARRLHRHVVVTGNPVRRGLNAGDRKRGLAWMGFSDELPILYVTGGARGASPINQRIAALLPGILDHAQILHQTGPASANADASDLRATRDALPAPLRARYTVVEFVRDELPDVYAAANLVLGRAGAGTIAELAYVGKPALLIPLPGAGGNEQALNAQVLGDTGGAIIIPQHEATVDRLRGELLSLLADPDRRCRMGIAIQTAAQPNAAANLADELVSIGLGHSALKAR